MQTLFKPFAMAASEFRTWATDPTPRLGIGYPLFDGRTNGGAAKGEVILFQARSSVGKTAFALNVVKNLGTEIPAVFFSLEMNARYLVPRLAAMHTGIPAKDIEQHMAAHGGHEAVQRTVNDFPLLAVPDKPAMSLKEMQFVLEEAKQVWHEPARFVVIDFLELIGGVPSLSTVDKIDTITRGIKNFARSNDVVVLLLHQVSRGDGAGDQPLDLTSGRFGGETVADYVLGGYRQCLRKGITQQEYLDERHVLHLQFLKTRGGSEIHPGGDAHYMDPHTLRIKTWHDAQPELRQLGQFYPPVPTIGTKVA